MESNGHPARQLDDGQRVAVELVRIEDDEVAPIELAVVAQREYPAVTLGSVWRPRDEHGLAGDVTDAEIVRDRRPRLDVLAAQ
jgi:hypothetical protein